MQDFIEHDTLRISRYLLHFCSHSWPQGRVLAPPRLSLQLYKYKKKKEKKNFPGERFTEEDDFLKLSHDTNAKTKTELSKLVPSLKRAQCQLNPGISLLDLWLTCQMLRSRLVPMFHVPPKAIITQHRL